MKPEVNLENEIQILKSKSLITKAFKDLEFEVSYLLKGNIKSTELYNKSPIVVKPDTLYEFAYFTDFDVNFINENTFELSYFPYKSKEKKPTYIV